MAQEYFFNASSTASELSVLNKKYDAVVTAALEIGKLLKQYVCVKGKWNDENAVTFADWWNQNGSGGGAGGALKWDATNKLLYMSRQTGSQSDGEDLIRHVVSMTAAAYYLTTCKSFNALSSSYSKQMKKYDAYIKAAKNSTYTSKLSDFGGTRWPKLMKTSFGRKAWSDTKLSTKASGSVTSAVEVKKMANQLVTKLKTLNNKVDDFCEEINKVVNNTNSSKYWGFSVDLKVEIVRFIDKLNNNTTKWLKSFASNTNTALATANNVVSSDLASLSKIRFS